MCVYLQVGIAVVGSGGVDPVLVRDDFPELGTDLVAALAGLEVDDFSHSGKGFFESKKTLNNDDSRSIVRCNRAEEIDWWKKKSKEVSGSSLAAFKSNSQTGRNKGTTLSSSGLNTSRLLK
jgi:hypothetical protein